MRIKKKIKAIKVVLLPHQKNQKGIRVSNETKGDIAKRKANPKR